MRPNTFSTLFNNESGLKFDGRERSPDLNVGHTLDIFHEDATVEVFNE